MTPYTLKTAITATPTIIIEIPMRSTFNEWGMYSEDLSVDELGSH